MFISILTLIILNAAYYAITSCPFPGAPPGNPELFLSRLKQPQRGRAGSPLRLETLGLPRRGCHYPAGALSFGLSQVGLGLICTAPGGIVRARPVLSPTQPINGTGQPRTGCSSHDIPLGAARPPYGPAQHVQTQLPTRSAADSRHSEFRIG